ncbi:MAG: antibiotic biosynthesis monooxygenase [Pseudomonadota bacterium]
MNVLRMWHGRVPTEKASAYRAFLERTAIPDYQSVDGCLSVRILERADGDVTHFITMTEWESREHIVRFAGEDIEVAKYYPEDKEYLLEFEPNVVHYDVVAQAG